ncbi:CRISPR-associated Cse1 family protein [Streptomyces sp. 3212.3]|uniref:type I-E CRISPR-associated protein Cse1/CasA n=1 Tax=Streptomyces sp. 3212.3 TaxID=1938846 RepID=UPI000E21EEFE|nr:type I-E CRISPR-associated protein Cse1/CasA [Streptomyces sp. 3212.3]REE61423.1 CRISPR-associated Cse1 family protein [Streptomyces sp. 3212.3]
MGGGFDLRDEPWVPVRLVSGESVRVGFRGLFTRAHEIEDLELPVAPAASGLMRILAAMTTRMAHHEGVRLDDEDAAEEIAAWYALRRAVLGAGRFDPDAVDAYFDEQVPERRFDLFDEERPFLQDPRLAKECVDGQGRPNTSGVNKLVMGRPTGDNGAVLFGHFTDGDPVPVLAAEATWHLIAQLYFGPSGQCTPRKITQTRPGNGDAAPLRKSISYFPWAPDLFTTLVLAVPAPGQHEPDEADACPWEEQEPPDPLGPCPALSWPCRVLTGRFRHAALLVPSADRTEVTDAYITWSTHEAAHQARDPFLILDRRRDGGLQAREADGSRALWRDVDALLLMDSMQYALRPPALEGIPDALRNRLRVRAYGFDQDGQQKDNGWFQATTPPILQWQQEVHPEMAAHVERCHRAAEDAGERLEFAAKVAWKLATDVNADASGKVKLDRRKPGPWAAAAAARYWTAAEREFWQLATPGRTSLWPQPAFVNAALAALDAAIGTANRADVRVARARSRARAIIRGLLQAPTAA